MKLIEKLEKCFDFWFLLLFGTVFFVLRIPSLIEPYWYGDEGIYHVLGSGIRNGRLLYEGAWDNKPPLLYLIYALFNSDQFLIRLSSAIVGVLSLVVFFYLCKELFKKNYKNKYAFLPTIVFGLLFATPIIEGNIANAENFMVLPLILAGFILVKYAGRKILDVRYSILAGSLLSFAFLIKIVAMFDFAAFFLFLLFINTPPNLSMRNLSAEIKKILPFLVGFLSPILLTFLFFFFKGAMSDFTQASFLQNIGYVGYGNKFIIPQGLLILKILILGLVSVFLFIKRGSLNSTHLFIFLWLAFSMYNAFFSQRPYTHYLLVLLPSFSLLFGLLLWDKKMQKITLLTLIAVLITVLSLFKYYGKIIGYYENYISFITGTKSIYAYRGFFDRATPADYEISSYIKRYSGKDDSIFLWGNNAQVYVLSGKLPPGRFTVAYHILGGNGIKETGKALEKENPRFIIIMKNVPSYPFSLNGYRERVRIGGAIIYEKLI